MRTNNVLRTLQSCKQALGIVRITSRVVRSIPSHLLPHRAATCFAKGPYFTSQCEVPVAMAVAAISYPLSIHSHFAKTRYNGKSRFGARAQGPSTVVAVEAR